jgi:hypothetical protein
MRALGGIVAGLVAGLVAAILIGIVGMGATMSGHPVQVDLNRPDRVIDAFAAMPTGPKLALVAAWFACGLVGALVAKLISRKGWAAWAVTLLVAAYVLLNVMILPLAGWLQALSVIAPLVGGLIGNGLVRGSTIAPAATTTEAEEASAAT